MEMTNIILRIFCSVMCLVICIVGTTMLLEENKLYKPIIAILVLAQFMAVYYIWEGG